MPKTLDDCGLWCGEPIILASKSKGRAQLLSRAGIPFVTADSRLNERKFEDSVERPPVELAKRLAIEKARIVSAAFPDRFVIGADQVLVANGKVLHKAASRDQAIGQLQTLRGRSHYLHSAAACYRNGHLEFAFANSAEIVFRDFSDQMLVAYVEAMGERLLETVGGYEIEGIGVNLVERIEGDLFTIVGLPLLELLQEFRNIGLIGERRIAK